MVYIFSYGTLINPNTRALTGESFDSAIPANIKGYCRRWSVVIKNQGRISLGVEINEESYCNGTIVSILEKELKKFDKRESEYDRIALNSSAIESLEGALPNEVVWLYIPKKVELPSKENPISQSYLDAALAGCLTIHEDFARTFIRSTIDWDKPWINDRVKPRYPRALAGLPVDEIDLLLKEELGGLFLQRIEENI